MQNITAGGDWEQYDFQTGELSSKQNKRHSFPQHLDDLKMGHGTQANLGWKERRESQGLILRFGEQWLNNQVVKP